MVFQMFCECGCNKEIGLDDIQIDPDPSAPVKAFQYECEDCGKSINIFYCGTPELVDLSEYNPEELDIEFTPEDDDINKEMRINLSGPSDDDKVH